jgi:hypothetical protein
MAFEDLTPKPGEVQRVSLLTLSETLVYTSVEHIGAEKGQASSQTIRWQEV